MIRQVFKGIPSKITITSNLPGQTLSIRKPKYKRVQVQNNSELYKQMYNNRKSINNE